VQVFSTYFRLPDVTSHLADHWLNLPLYEETMRREGPQGLRPEDEARIDRAFADLLAPAYEFMDRTIAKYMARMDAHTLLVVCSDHGFRFFRGSYSHANPEQSPPDGVIFLAGAGIKKGHHLEDAVLYDVAPTILYALGQPVPADMDGKLLRGAFQEGYLRWWPPRRIASYETKARPTTAGENAEVDREVLQDLGTLGYIEVPPAAPSPPAPRPSPAPAAR
jgi:arylsulfatase A-like enzyme